MKARETNIRLYGSDFYRSIGAKGGRIGGAKGFALNPGLARIAGRKGGKKSSRGRALHRIMDGKEDEIIRMLQTGATYKDISDRLEVPYYSVRNWVHKNALEYINTGRQEKETWRK